MANATQKPKQKKIALIACLLGGMLGAHKFYEEKYLMGVLYLLTCGFFMIGVIIDLIKLIQQPSVYYVQKQSFRFNPAAAKEMAESFPVEKVGKIVAIIGGGIAGLGCSMEFHMTFILIGLAIAVVGIVITWLKSRDIIGALTGSGIPAVIAAVAVFAFLLLIAFVIVWLALKLILGLDLLELFGINLFSDDKEPEYTPPKPFAFPQTLTDRQGNVYRLESTSNDHADYYCPSTGDRRVVWESDLNSD